MRPSILPKTSIPLLHVGCPEMLALVAISGCPSFSRSAAATFDRLCRKASLPVALSFENTHPFDRELFGRRFVFAHNGHLPGIERLSTEPLQRFMPLGETDSERAFCLMLNLLSQRSHDGYQPRTLQAVLRELSAPLLALGRCNYLLSDGERLFAHGDNSLHSVTRSCAAETHTVQSDILRMRMEHTAPQRAALVATVPLTDAEDWRR